MGCANSCRQGRDQCPTPDVCAQPLIRRVKPYPLVPPEDTPPPRYIPSWNDALAVAAGVVLCLISAFLLFSMIRIALMMF